MFAEPPSSVSQSVSHEALSEYKAQSTEDHFPLPSSLFSLLSPNSISLSVAQHTTFHSHCPSSFYYFFIRNYFSLSTLHYPPSSSLSLTRLVPELISSGAHVLLPGPIWFDRLSVYPPSDLQIQKGTRIPRLLRRILQCFFFFLFCGSAFRLGTVCTPTPPAVLLSTILSCKASYSVLLSSTSENKRISWYSD